jgi:signal transduction histidine kinase
MYEMQYKRQADRWGNMTIKYSQLGEPLASEVIGTHIELTGLARKAYWAASEQLDSVANDLLTCVLALCKAECGAILLSKVHPRFVPFGAESSASPEDHALRVLALHQMREEEVNGLLAPMIKPGAPVPSLDMARWMVFRLPLDEVWTDEAQDQLAMLPGTLFDPPRQGQHALLIIGRRDQQARERPSTSLVSRCSVLLPLVANAFGTVIITLLLKERLDELEREVVRKALESMELLKAKQLGTVSHELRGPLASIKGYATTLLRHEHRLGYEERHQFLGAINEASDRLNVIIERLLELSQLETGQTRLKCSPVDMAQLAHEAIDVIEERVTVSLPSRFVFNLRLENADGIIDRIVPLIVADPSLLREMLDHLLENAIKFSPGGGLITIALRPVVQVSPEAKTGDVPCTRQERDPNKVPVSCNLLELRVTDDGEGIPADQLERIFERFHRADTRLTRETGGLGLGLAICKHIVELHGGAIWAENRPSGKGSVVYVQLPIDGSAAFT